MYCTYIDSIHTLYTHTIATAAAVVVLGGEWVGGDTNDALLYIITLWTVRFCYPKIFN